MRPVPMKVPIVSNVSARLKAKIVTRIFGSLLGSLNRDNRPGLPKIAPKVFGSSATASLKLMVSANLVMPSGMPTSVEMIIPSKMAPLTLRTRRIMVKTNPKIAKSTGAVLKLTRAGTAAELPTTVKLSAI